MFREVWLMLTVQQLKYLKHKNLLRILLYCRIASKLNYISVQNSLLLILLSNVGFFFSYPFILTFLFTLSLLFYFCQQHFKCLVT